MVHVHEDTVILAAKREAITIQPPELAKAVFSLLFAERVHMDICWKCMLAFNETNHMHHLAMLRKLLNPSMKKAEYRVIFIHGLGTDEEFH